MRPKSKVVLSLILLLTIILIRVYATQKIAVEGVFATKIYPVVGEFFRIVFGWLPFSIGDILYGIFFLWILLKLVKGIKNIFLGRINRTTLKKTLWKGFVFLALTYIFFNLFWGLNYNRLGIAHQLQIKKEIYTAEDLKKVNELLVQKINMCKLSLLLNKESYPSNRQLFKRVDKAYQQVNTVLPFLDYKHRSIKSSMWGWLGNYTGFTGYYNPFTGEAQVNTTIPKFLHPFITCHEVAHQLGYAKENEANFVGFLAATLSSDSLLKYSTYLDMFMYCNRNLYRQDTASAKSFAKALIPMVKDDIKEWKIFNSRHKSFLEPAVRWGYTQYLKQNNQPEGILSYDAVTIFLIGYYKKYGKL